MARPQRKNVDYFPFYCKEGKGMFYIEQKYKNDGFATWIKILRELAAADNHYLNLSEEIQLMYLSAKCKVEIDMLKNIINDLVKLGEFDYVLWNENSIIFSEKFIASIEEAYKKRSNKCIDKQGLLILLDSLGIRKLYKSTSEVPIKPQRKEEYSKEKNNKEYKNKLLSEINISDLSQENQNYFNIANSFKDLIIKSCKDFGISTKNIDKTKGVAIDEIRLLITNDGYTIEDCQKVFKFLESEIPKGGFSWKQNILSIKTLRKKFDKLKIAANETNRKNSSASNGKGVDGEKLRKMLEDKFGEN